MRRKNDCATQVRPAFFLTAAFALVLLPAKWLLAWGIASLFHEACHILCLRLMGLRILTVILDGNGTRMEVEPMLPLQEFICALSGPIGALLLLVFSAHFPALSICALLQSAFNLLPIYPLDGGRALHNLILILLDEKKAVLFTECVNIATLGLLGAFSVVLQLKYGCGLAPMVLTLLLYFRSRKSIILSIWRVMNF